MMQQGGSSFQCGLGQQPVFPAPAPDYSLQNKVAEEYRRKYLCEDASDLWGAGSGNRAAAMKIALSLPTVRVAALKVLRDAAALHEMLIKGVPRDDIGPLGAMGESDDDPDDLVKPRIDPVVRAR
ncbi:hypothetical protein CHELA1G11_12972 [Hyphomicrobiales bacterium]|nr:hypothetical protein CHELA1G2_11338 [Hyphomicrobiales bacterium]CAH1668412.1 hypothetical protein CHELA1G11_12972 [Hyphomicrobiales bacterium]